MQALSSFSFADPRVIQDPYPYYERMRAEDPVHFDEGIKTWLVTRHDDIIAVARNTTVFSDEMRVSDAIRSPFQDEANEFMRREGFLPLGQGDGLKVDGAVHTRRRTLIVPAFTGPNVAAMEPRIAELCRDTADALSGGSEVDLVRDYAMPIPILVICDLLGMPMDRVDDLSRGADSMVARLGAGATREVALQHAHNLIQLQRMVQQAIEARRDTPGTDLISGLVHARIDDPEAPQLNERELLAISTIAVAGGVDTTRNSIAFGLHALAMRPELLGRLRTATQQDKAIARFCEEVLRYYSPSPQLPRITTQDTVLRGKAIPKGAAVLLCWASGNRDTERFTDPDTFDMDRSNLNQHLAFGVGVHHCIGAFLARQEMKCAIREIVERMDSIELALPHDQLDLSNSIVILRGLKSLPVRLTLASGRC
jgi:cytochrome P450